MNFRVRIVTKTNHKQEFTLASLTSYPLDRGSFAGQVRLHLKPDEVEMIRAELGEDTHNLFMMSNVRLKGEIKPFFKCEIMIGAEFGMPVHRRYTGKYKYVDVEANPADLGIERGENILIKKLAVKVEDGKIKIVETAQTTSGESKSAPNSRRSARLSPPPPPQEVRAVTG